MFEKDLKLTFLLDFYGEVLDEHTRSVMKAYYDDDLSLSEVAATVGISRQGVRHVIKKGEEQLRFLESRLGLAERHKELIGAADSLREAALIASTLGEEGIEVSAKIGNAVELILKKGV